MSFDKVFWTATIIIMVSVGVFIYEYVWGSWSVLEPLERISSAQLYFSVATFVAIVFTLLYATVQVRRVLARPQLKMVIGEERETKTSVIVPLKLLEERQTWEGKLALYIYNGGNLVSDLYNVEFELPSVFNPYLRTKNELYGVNDITGSPLPGGETVIIPFYSHKLVEYTCFVHKYVAIGIMCLRITPDNRDKYPRHFEIGYRIFGNWVEKQEGVLTVTFKIE